MALTLDFVLSKSEARIRLLHPVVQLGARALITLAHAKGIYITIAQGLRTIAEQDALFFKGRDAEGKVINAKEVVTKARGGTSYHNYGLAIDFCLLMPDGKNVSWSLTQDLNGDKKADWMQVIEIGESLGFYSGIHFRTMYDPPHLEMTFGLSTTQLFRGSKPTAAQITKATAQINSVLAKNSTPKEDEPMTAEEKKAFTELQESLKKVTGDLATAQKDLKALQDRTKMDCPAWAKVAIEAAQKCQYQGKPLVDTADGGSYDFYRIITVMYRKGFFN